MTYGSFLVTFSRSTNFLSYFGHLTTSLQKYSPLPIYWAELVSFEWALIGGQTGRGLSAVGNVHSAVASKQSFSSDWEVGMTQPLSHLKLVPTCARCLPLMDPFLSRNLSHVVVLKFKLMQFNLLFTVLNLSYLAHESKGWLVMCSPITNDLTIN